MARQTTGLIADGRKRPFVVIEGADGAGTTTQVQAMGRQIGRAGLAGVRAVSTRLPTDGEFGRLLRAMLRGERPTWGWQVQTHLFCADRCLHVTEVVDPALGIGPKAWAQPAGVLLDRYGYSTAVYQGLQAAVQVYQNGSYTPAWRGVLQSDWVKGLMRQMREAHGWREPDLAVLLDVDPEEAARRRAARSGVVEVFDGLAFQEDVVKTYRALWAWLQKESGDSRYVVVDGNQPVAAVTEQIMQAAWPLFKGCEPCAVTF
jgi:dTMP kinase